MNLEASTIVLRPRTVAEVMDLTCRLTFTESLGIYTRIAAFALLLPYAGLMALHYLLDLEWAWVWGAGLLLSIFAQGPFTIAASRMLFGEKPQALSVLKLFGQRFFSYLGAMSIKLFFNALGAMFCLGVFITWPNGVLVPEASLLEGAKASEAWGRSKRLVAQRAGDSLAALLALITAKFAFVASSELLGQSLMEDILQLGHPLGTLLEHGGSPFAIAGLFLAAPFIATARFLHYIDTRTRADGWDIQVKFMALVAKHDEQAQAARGGT